MNKIATIIVTYNRKTELLRCLDSVFNQTLKSDYVIVVNNASSDGTEVLLKERYPYLIEEKNETGISKDVQKKLILINLNKNTGGSGGFFTGMKYAHEILNANLYWLMDDDGYPSQNCLEMLVEKSYLYDYVMPVSIDIINHTKLSWPVRKRNGKKTDNFKDLKESWGEILDYVTPFNGILLSKKTLDEVGYINPQFFIWGDEYDHYWRCIKKNIRPVTYLNAIFYHPAAKLPLVRIFFGLLRVPYVDSEMRMVCLTRNYTYIYRHYNQKWKIPLKWLMYFWLFHFTRHNDKKGWKLYKESVKDGFKEDFTRHLQYLK